MSRNGSGTFVINSAGQPVVAGTTITATAFNALTADLATGLTQSICTDGQTTTTVSIPFAQGLKTTTVDEVAAKVGVPLMGTTAVSPTNAAVGYVGEWAETVVTDGAAVAVTSGVDKTIASVNLTPGDWDICGNIVTTPAAGTTTSQIAVGINGTTDTLPTVEQRFQSGAAIPASQRTSASIANRRISIGASGTLYLVANVIFAVSTMSCCGYINARRAR